jgi:hypothetical protein
LDAAVHPNRDDGFVNDIETIAGEDSVLGIQTSTTSLGRRATRRKS